MEFPISFFLDYAWNPEKIDAGLQTLYKAMGRRRICVNTQRISPILFPPYQYNGRRNTELLSPETYSLNIMTSASVVRDYNNTAAKADTSRRVAAGYRDAYFELVLPPARPGHLE